jgi:hypothetical protein
MLHFTVGTAISTRANTSLDEGLDTSHEFRLLKAALLYADQVTFYSYAPTSLLPLMQPPKQMSEDEKLNWFLDFYIKLGHPPHIQQVTTFVEEYKASKARKDRISPLSISKCLAKSCTIWKKWQKSGHWRATPPPVWFG